MTLTFCFSISAPSSCATGRAPDQCIASRCRRFACSSPFWRSSRFVSRSLVAVPTCAPNTTLCQAPRSRIFARSRFLLDDLSWRLTFRDLLGHDLRLVSRTVRRLKSAWARLTSSASLADSAGVGELCSTGVRAALPWRRASRSSCSAPSRAARRGAGADGAALCLRCGSRQRRRRSLPSAPFRRHYHRGVLTGARGARRALARLFAAVVLAPAAHGRRYDAGHPSIGIVAVALGVMAPQLYQFERE